MKNIFKRLDEDRKEGCPSAKKVYEFMTAKKGNLWEHLRKCDKCFAKAHVLAMSVIREI